MRQIGTVPDARDAQRLADFLLTLGIRTRLDSADNATAVWVYDEDHRERAAAELAQFCANPADPRYAAAAGEARKIEHEAAAAERRFRKNYVEMRERWGAITLRRRPVTMTLIAISVVVALMTDFGQTEDLTWFCRLSITPPVVENGRLIGLAHLSETFRGEIWRLVTPIFWHVNLMHLLFNALAITTLGTQVEILRGSWRMLGIVLLTAVVSNLSQYFVEGPYFGGLSGVAYALFGYIWMKSRYEPRSGFYLDPSSVFVMMAWFVLCFTPLLGHVAGGMKVANAAHAGGLIAGLVLGIAPTAWRALRG